MTFGIIVLAAALWLAAVPAKALDLAGIVAALQGTAMATGTNGFYPLVEVVFEIVDGAAHYHVPLLLNPWGYSTYRGS